MAHSRALLTSQGVDNFVCNPVRCAWISPLESTLPVPACCIPWKKCLKSMGCVFHLRCMLGWVLTRPLVL